MSHVKLAAGKVLPVAETDLWMFTYKMIQFKYDPFADKNVVAFSTMHESLRKYKTKSQAEAAMNAMVDTYNLGLDVA